jgi:hypothetical protein
MRTADTVFEPPSEQSPEWVAWHHWLNDLGTTPAEVAETLSQRGARGYTSDPHSCPLAVAARAAGLPDARVTGAYLTGWPAGATACLAVRLPAPVSMFVALFDRQAPGYGKVSL